MAKKKPASKTYVPPRKKPVSVKRIIAEIDRTLAKLEPSKADTAKRSPAGGDAYALDRSILSLRGARDMMKGLCVPGFDIPI